MFDVTNLTKAQIYETIFALPPEQQSEALHEWWALCKSICTPEQPCLECLCEQLEMTQL